MTGSGAGVAVVCWLTGATVVAVTWWDSGDQGSSATQLPAVLVALGAGLGLIVVGAALWSLDRSRARARRQVAGLAAIADLAQRRGAQPW